jgi:phosphate transport system protein
MTREAFPEALDRMERELLTLGDLAAAAVANGTRSLVERDDELAQAVIAGDDAIDELYLAIDHGTLSLLALQQPVAADLRLISTILHSCLHLERIGDQAVNIAKIHLATRELPASDGMRAQVSEMGDRATEMVRTAMRAFADRDLEAVRRLPQMDDPIDRLNRMTHLEALKLADDHGALDWGLHMNLAARALERVGDNAVDIGEQVNFLVSGEFMEFTDASHKDDRPGGGAPAEA